MSWKTKWIAGMAAVALMPAACHADDASKRAKLHEMFRLSHTDRMLTVMFAAQEKQLPQLLRRLVPTGQITPAQQADLDAFLRKIHEIVQQAASWDKLEPQFTDIYASIYSEQEVDGLIAFYKSPVGAEMVARQPEIIEKSQAVTESLMSQVQPQILQAAMQFAQEMQSKYGNKAAPPASAPSGPANR